MYKLVMTQFNFESHHNKKLQLRTHTTGSPCIWIGVGLLMPFFFKTFKIVFGNFISCTVQCTYMQSLQ